MVKFLIIRFSSIGDIVLTSPVIRCLKKQVEGAEIHYVTKGAFKDVLKANPYIDKLWLYKNNMNELSLQLNREKYDHIIDLHNSLRSGILKRKLKLPSVTVNKINWQKWVMVNLKINRLPDRHIVDRYMDTLHFLM
ncbi:MAG: glycosyltransferase family 9 protein [Bacteroidota bacterium]